MPNEGFKQRNKQFRRIMTMKRNKRKIVGNHIAKQRRMFHAARVDDHFDAK